MKRITLLSISLLLVFSVVPLFSDKFSDLKELLKNKDFEKAKELYYSILEEGIFDSETWEKIGDNYRDIKMHQGAAISYLIAINLKTLTRIDVSNLQIKVNKEIEEMKRIYKIENYFIYPVRLNNTVEMLDSVYYDGRQDRIKMVKKKNFAVIPFVRLVPIKDEVLKKIPEIKVPPELLTLIDDFTDEDGDNQYGDKPASSGKSMSRSYDSLIIVDNPPSTDMEKLKNNIVYPEFARMAGIEGKIIIRLFIDKKGNPKYPVIIKSNSIFLNYSAMIAVLKSDYIPAEIKGEATGCWLTIPIKYSLEY